ncbi:MAG TPA: DsbA family oxidoreductase [Candidatus Limnocylindria bacterium]|nr:DsbA family oxidoreductase [Candidatus Limnocylindria bacterium]
MSQPIKIDVWSDIACPWCYIGKRNLETAIAAFRGRPEAAIEVEFRSFELAPDTPVDFEGSELDYLARIKGISREQAQAMHDRVSAIAAGVGLRYDFSAVKHTRTLKAHQLLHYAKARGTQAEMTERLMSAYFAEGRHVGRDEELASLAAEVGLDPDDVKRSLAADEHLDDVRADQALARAYGIGGVPFFVIDGRYAVSGAQPAEVFVQALDMVARERAAA